MRRLFAAVVLAVGVSACTDRDIIVESNTTWSGFIGEEESGYSRDGSGNARFEIDDSGRTCWTFQKETEAGYLRAYAKTKEIFGTDRQGDARTTTAFGIVSGCVD